MILFFTLDRFLFFYNKKKNNLQVLQDYYVAFQKNVLSIESLFEKESYMKLQYINRCKWRCSAAVEIGMQRPGPFLPSTLDPSGVSTGLWLQGLMFESHFDMG